MSTTPPVSSVRHRLSRHGVAATGFSPSALVLAAAVPIVFVHARYQPAVSVGAGGTDVRLALSDAAVAAVVVAAAARGTRRGLTPLRPARWQLAALAGLLGWIAISLVLPGLRGEPYDTSGSLVSAAKFAEYALLAAAAPLLAARRRDLEVLVGSLVAVSVCATGWAILQYVGAVEAFDAGGQWRRAPSFVGIHDFAALSGATLAVGLVGLLLRERFLHARLSSVAGVSGALGLVLSGAMAAVVGIVLAAAALVLVAHRRGALTRRGVAGALVTVVAVTGGTALMRSSTLVDFAGFLGLRDDEPSGAVESYSQRSVLAYIGYRIFLTEPVTGVGWQGSGQEWAYAPTLADARARFPSEPAEAFPSPEHPWGVQNAYVQTLADLGVIGFALLLAVLAVTLRVAWRSVSRGAAPALGLAWLLVAIGVWNGLGLVSGIPLAALTWLAVGLVGAGD